MKIVTFQPLPISKYDWCARFSDGSNGFMGRGQTEEEAIADLLEAADACPQCHGPVHESGFCPSCKESVA